MSSLNISVSPNSKFHQIHCQSLSRENAEILKPMDQGYQWEGIRLDGLVLIVGVSTFKHCEVDWFICLFIQVLWYSENIWLTDWIIWNVVGGEIFIQSASACFFPSVIILFFQTLSRADSQMVYWKCFTGTCEALQSACQVICLPHLWNPIT